METLGLCVLVSACAASSCRIGQHFVSLQLWRELKESVALATSSRWLCKVASRAGMEKGWSVSKGGVNWLDIHTHLYPETLQRTQDYLGWIFEDTNTAGLRRDTLNTRLCLLLQRSKMFSQTEIMSVFFACFPDQKKPGECCVWGTSRGLWGIISVSGLDLKSVDSYWQRSHHRVDRCRVWWEIR